MLENSHWNVQYVNIVWTAHLVKRLQQYNVQTQTVNLSKIEPHRINYSTLMENKLASNRKSSLAIKQFNACRLFTRVIYLSELCNTNGNELDPKRINYSTSIDQNYDLPGQLNQNP